MTLFPQLLHQLETLKMPLQTSLACTELQSRSLAAGLEMLNSNQRLTWEWLCRLSRVLPLANHANLEQIAALYRDGAASLLESLKSNFLEVIDNYRKARAGELALINLFTNPSSTQAWSSEAAPNRLLLDLPGMRVFDISRGTLHAIRNYTVVFAPRAGHHSNIAERVALYLRDRGLSRMAVVEQKCAEDIPLFLEGRRHREDFESQVRQYRAVLEHLNAIGGCPPHLVAVCQPGPLLLTTLILHPHLGRTFGSAGAPMHTAAEPGFLTDFARAVGAPFIDHMIDLFGRRIADDRPGAGRLSYDGRLQVLGFYLLGYDLHLRNLRKLLLDLKKGNRQSAERQMAFYQWYNTVHHFPAGFIRDTFKKIFIENALINGTLVIGNRHVGIADYPVQIPIWALGGLRDNIAPPLQAVGHIDLIGKGASDSRLKLLCDAGHMGLFRSRRILEVQYSGIAEFMLGHSDS
jgi:polyhydroxyalkanoate depolymerase